MSLNLTFKNAQEFKLLFQSEISKVFGKSLSQTTDIEKYLVLCKIVEENAVLNWKATKDLIRNKSSKQVYYFSLEFLMGRMLSNNMMNMGIYEIVKQGLDELEIDINQIEDLEADAGLGNGGLGRLAACFMDSLASLNYPGNGNTIRYKNGLFKQLIVDNEQVEVPDQWLKLSNPWELRKPHKAIEVKFYGDVNISLDHDGRFKFKHENYESVLAVPYDMPIVGAQNSFTNTLRMWSAEPSDIIPKDRDYRKYLSDVEDICLNLYPDDSTEKGRMLRVKQEYFFVSAGINSIVNEHLKSNLNLDNLHEKVTIHLNDTHPALCVAELMRIMLDDYNYEWNHAFDIVSKTLAYTNHTIMQEALEKWPVKFIKTLLPRIYLIVEEIDKQFRRKLLEMGKSDEFINSVAIINNDHVEMAKLAIVGSFSVNGVAKLHTDILIQDTFSKFYEIFPNKFNNKTNGVTHRRWLMYSNKELTSLIEDYIGKGFHKDFSKIKELERFVDDEKLQERFLEVKKKRKEILSDYLNKTCGIKLDTNSIFDVQAKRLHAYKRQLLNILHVIYLYQKLKNDTSFTMPKTTFIFGAKAASGYYFAKKVIKLINCVANKIKQDEHVSKFIDVCFIPNYRVTIAEKLMNAADVSEQISTAGKEASGTGNMKFMINGAITLGTLDGANVEIDELVGSDNIVIFGKKSEEIYNFKQTYSSMQYYKNNIELFNVINSLVDGTFSSNLQDFECIFNELTLQNDEYLNLADFNSYKQAHETINSWYKDPKSWAKKCLINIARSYKFTTDRTINEYAKDIWHIERIKND